MARAFSRLWNVHLRGDFGLSPGHVLRNATAVWLTFAAVYLICAIFGFAWAAQVPVDLAGTPRGDPAVLRLGQGARWQLANALAFSADRLVFGGTRLFQVEQIFDNLAPEPARFVAVGVGRLLGATESIIGLLLLANLIQAIVKTT